MRYFAIFLVFIALILFGIVIFGGNSGSKSNKSTSSSSVQAPKALPDYADTGAIVRLTTDGPINGDDIHRQIQLTVSSTTRTLDIIQGYQGTVIQTESFANNEPAYSAFLNALYKSGYTLKLTSKQNKFASDSDQGSCPLGDRYYYQLMNTDNNADQSLWSSSCGKTVPGNFGGAGPLVQQLFQVQFGNYNVFTQNVGI